MVSTSEVDEMALATRADIECTLMLQRVRMALTCAVLYSLVVELVLKHIWENEQGMLANSTITYTACLYS